MSLKFLNIKSTARGNIYLLDTVANNWGVQNFDSKKDYTSFSVQKIVANLLPGYRLEHDENGAPLLIGEQQQEISISHAGSYFAIYVSTEFALGIDVEIERKDLSNRSTYFLNKHELAKTWSNQELYLIWCAKEVYYKLKKGKIKDLNSAITVLNISNSEINVILSGKKSTLYYELTSQFILVYS